VELHSPVRHGFSFCVRGYYTRSVGVSVCARSDHSNMLTCAAKSAYTVRSQRICAFEESPVRKVDMLNSRPTGSNGGNCVEDWHQEFSSRGQVSRVHFGAGTCGSTESILIVGLGGLVVPFIARALLQSYGRKTTCLSFVSTDTSSRRFHYYVRRT
jgi:hypothetical protein